MTDPFLWMIVGTAIFLWFWCLKLTNQLNRAERREMTWRCMCMRWEKMYNELVRQRNNGHPRKPGDEADWWKE